MTFPVHAALINAKVRCWFSLHWGTPAPELRQSDTLLACKAAI